MTLYSSVQTVSRSVEVGNPCRPLERIISHQPALVICDPTKNCCLIMKKDDFASRRPTDLCPKCPKPSAAGAPAPDPASPLPIATTAFQLENFSIYTPACCCCCAPTFHPYVVNIYCNIFRPLIGKGASAHLCTSVVDHSTLFAKIRSIVW